MMRAEMRVGRLLEVRASLPIRVEEIPALTQSMLAIYGRAPPLVVAILDARTYGLEPPDATDYFVGALRRDNPRIERSAFVIEPHQNLLALQLERVIREAGNPRRRLFRSAPAAAAFLRSALTTEESARLDAFLSVEESRGWTDSQEAAQAQRLYG
jgi:hypothetical protein